MYSKSDNENIMINDEVDKVIEERFQSLLSRYQIWLGTSMKGIDAIFDLVLFIILQMP